MWPQCQPVVHVQIGKCTARRHKASQQPNYRRRKHVKHSHTQQVCLETVWCRSNSLCEYFLTQQVKNIVGELTVRALEVDEVKAWETAVTTLDKLFSTVTSATLLERLKPLYVLVKERNVRRFRTFVKCFQPPTIATDNPPPRDCTL